MENNIPKCVLTCFEDGLLFHRNPRGGASDLGKSRVLSEHHRWSGPHCGGDRQRGDVLCSHEPGLPPDSGAGEETLRMILLSLRRDCYQELGGFSSFMSLT